jgi:prespore-specific regulator
VKVRQDAWSHEDDLLLAETVLRHIRDGSTQVAAFEEVCDRLNRTAAACGYRWNAEVRSQYVQAVEFAKKQRKEKKRSSQNAKKKQVQKLQTQPTVYNQQQKIPIPGNESEIAMIDESYPSITLDDCIAFLSNYSSQGHPILKVENNRLELENQQLKKENEKLILKYEKLKTRKQKIEHDYKLLMSVLNQARNMSDESFENKQFYNEQEKEA